MVNEKERARTSAGTPGILSKGRGEEQVVAVVGLKVETTEADHVALAVSKFSAVEDVFLVTGDIDVFLKVRFPRYGDLKDFVLHRLPEVRGIRESKTLLVVTTYKERGVRSSSP